MRWHVSFCTFKCPDVFEGTQAQAAQAVIDAHKRVRRVTCSYQVEPYTDEFRVYRLVDHRTRWLANLQAE